MHTKPRSRPAEPSSGTYPGFRPVWATVAARLAEIDAGLSPEDWVACLDYGDGYTDMVEWDWARLGQPTTYPSDTATALAYLKDERNIARMRECAREYFGESAA